MAKKERRFLLQIEKAPLAMAVRRGLVMLIPVLLLGSVTLILKSFPIPAYQRFITEFLDASLLVVLDFIYNASFGMLSVFATLTISYCYACERKESGAYTFGAVLASLMVFFVLVGVLQNTSAWDALGAKGMFTAILSATCVPVLYFRLVRSFPPKRKPYSDGADAGFSKSVGIFVPILLIAVVFAIINTAIAEVFKVSGLHELFINAANALFAPFGRSIFSGVLFVLLSTLLWFFGIHGSDVFEGVKETFFVPATQINAELLAAGQPPTEILTKEFFDSFVLIGGCGTSLCLLLAILLFSRKTSNRSLAKMATLPMLFNINEVMVFGLPVIFNPTMLIPFILTPLVFFFVSYFAMSLGIVPLITSSVEWTTPVLISGYQTTGSLAGSALQLFALVLGVFIYRPFVLAYDRRKEATAKRHLKELVQLVMQDESSLQDAGLTELTGVHGEIARVLAADLPYAMNSGGLTLFYQPQYDNENRPVGAEALLRWFHPLFGAIYPPLIIALARESKKLLELEEKILMQAVSDAKKLWQETGLRLKFSINVSAETLCSEDYQALLQKLAKDAALSPGDICLEITEQTAFLSTEETSRVFQSVRELGFMFAIDDFSMGHTSLAYLQENRFDLVKLDGSLVRGIRENPRSREIIASIVHLSKSLGFEVLAEYVETEEMRSYLEQIGCRLYQGYLYSPAIPRDKLRQLLTAPKTETEN